MHVEIKVAQNFVLDFLYNKLPRRRVNLFGEELESALRDKFADHWYPDKPFKGSAFRCLKITDSADPVLNRAARESGNPIPDITENLPTDLAIWIDPGEVSYRIGEKGSVKILYSANDTINFPVGGAGSSSNTLVQEDHHNEPNLPTAVNNGFLPIENLNVAMNSLNVSSGSGPSNQMPRPLATHQQYHNNDQAPLQNPVAPLMNNMNMPLNPMMINNTGNNPGGSTAMNGSSNGVTNGFTPFPPRQQQPVTYTAGTFAQTKFGSTKLKSCGKKTNRMSPTEFSNYIKQRAMQKQGNTSMSTVGNMNCGGMIPPMNNITNVNNMVGNVGNQFRSTGNSGGSISGMNGGGRPMNINGFYGNSQANQSFNAFNCGADGGRMQQNMNQSSSNQQTSPDSFFYPLFPDRGRQQQSQQSKHNIGNQNNVSSAMMNISAPSMNQISSFSSGGNSGSLSSGGSSTGSSSASSTSSNNPWSYADADTENFLQDLFSMGLSSGKQGRNMYSDLSTNIESGNLTGNSSGNVSLNNFGGMHNTAGMNSSSGNSSNTNSLGLSGNFGTLGNLNTGNNSHGILNGGGVFGNSIDETVNGSSIKMMERMGSNPLSQSSGSQGVGTGNSDKYQHRVLVAN